MAFYQGGTTLRADLRGVVEEAFLQGELYIGAKAMPPLPVPAKQGQYPVIQKNGGDLLRDETKRRAAGATYPRIQRAVTTDTYDCIEYGLETIVDDGDNENFSRFFSLESFEIRRAYQQVQLAHERRVASALFAPATFNLTTAAVTYTSTNLATFDIGLDVDSAKQQIAQRGENVDNLTVVMSLNNFLRARASTKLQNRIRGTISTDAFLTLSVEAMAEAMQVKQILIGRAQYDTTPQGAAASSLSAIWSDTYLWVGNVANASGPEQYFSGGTGYTLFWEQDSDIFQVESYREDQRRSEIIRARQFTAEKIVLASGAQLVVTGYG